MYSKNLHKECSEKNESAYRTDSFIIIESEINRDLHEVLFPHHEV